MGEGPVAVVAAVLLDERGVVVLDAGVDRGDDDALAVDALGPQLGGADVLEVPRGPLLARLGLLGPERAGLALAVGRDRFDVVVFGRLDDGLDLVERDELLQEGGVGGDLDGRRAPERLVFGARRFERVDDVGLALLGVGDGGLDGGLALLLLLVGGEGVAPVGCAGEAEPQLGLAGPVDLFEDFGVGLLLEERSDVGAGLLGPGARGGRGRDERARERGREYAAEPR